MKDKFSKKVNEQLLEPELVNEIRELINNARNMATNVVNAALTHLYWSVGKRINDVILNGERAEYGNQIVVSLSRQLELEYGRGFSYSSITRMINFYLAYPKTEIVATLSQQLSWSHFRELLIIDDVLKREFYTEMCRIEQMFI